MPENKKDIKYYVVIGITLLVIAAVTSALLAAVNLITKDKIAENELAELKNAVTEIFKDSDDIKKVDIPLDDPVKKVYKVFDDGNQIGFCIQAEPVGFKDVISLIVCTDNDGVCKGVKVISISDTPGVGTKSKEPSYLDGYKGLEKEQAEQFDTITGATISSSAVKKGIVAALSLGIYGQLPETKAPEETTAASETTLAPETTATPETVETVPETTVPEPVDTRRMNPDGYFNGKTEGSVDVERKPLPTKAPETTAVPETQPPETQPPETQAEQNEETTGEVQTQATPENN